MAYDPEKHHRRSIRLKTHDYAGGGLYFVTLCAHRAAGPIFGNPAAKEMLSRIWQEIAMEAQGGAEGAGLVSALEPAPIPAFCIMPDHFHALIRIQKGAKSLGDFLCAFKSRTTLEYIRGVNAGQFPRFKNKIWHRNYYEMIVRSAEAESKIAEYIRLNPWKCVQQLANGLRGIGNPSLWNAEKLGVLCSRNAPVGTDTRPDLTGDFVAFGGWHSPKEKEMLAWLLEQKRPVIACPAWPIERAGYTPGFAEALAENRMLILEMTDRAGDLAAAEARNQFVIDHADALFAPHINPGGMLDRLLKKQTTLPKKEQHNEK